MTTVTEAADKPGLYRFGPRETRGVLLGLRAGQLALLLIGAAARLSGRHGRARDREGVPAWPR